LGLRDRHAIPPPPPPPPPSVACARREALGEVALALTEMQEAPLDALLRVTVSGAARIAGTGAVLLVTDGDGRLERLAAQGVDASMRDALTRPELVRAFVARLRALGRPVRPGDLDAATARILTAAAPHGFVLLPVDGDTALGLVGTAADAPVDEDAVAVAGMLAR